MTGPPWYPPPSGSSADPWAPYGRDPVSGEPFSDRSKVSAALLQLIGFFGLVGFGRIYLGQVGFGIAQMLGCLFIAGATRGIGIGVALIWGVIDAVLILTGRVRDAQHRLLR
ncbi:TM2 domain-containing protein [Mycobacterium sp. M1]|uniref:TM2 domain-containing protein n=1 Tax=Mycolicibacter acidiphilus TaxID=2835306 RepID=A0ABS5RIZ6_9MYCO|nr:TM2 domain-containing protein [Mycolicibacter acidiphilus]MBS9534272.1 TM2 domain-containing protein [Mycolicibacter acidiphilus]